MHLEVKMFGSGSFKWFRRMVLMGWRIKLRSEEEEEGLKSHPQERRNPVHSCDPSLGFRVFPPSRAWKRVRSNSKTTPARGTSGKSGILEPVHFLLYLVGCCQCPRVASCTMGRESQISERFETKNKNWQHLSCRQLSFC